MGAVLAKFRKEKTTYEVLENLEEEIKDIEEYTLSTQIQQKRYVGNFLLISIGLYIIGFIVFYFLFFPPTWMERITYSVPLLIFPMLIFFLKRLVAWYFQRKLNKNSSKLKVLRAEKKKLIEKVMDKETYKVAIEILNRFADKTNGFKPTGNLTPRPLQQVEQKNVANLKQVPQVKVQTPPFRGPAPMVENKQWSSYSPQRSMQPSTPLSVPGMQRRIIVSPELQQRRRTPYPIINPQTKGVLEKMVDYLIGDGPHNRFAMICRECYGHNGMAHQEEYEFAAFLCAFCGAMNPPRKMRPIAPRLPSLTPTHSTERVNITEEMCSSSTSPSEKDSGSDSDDIKNSDEPDEREPETPKPESEEIGDTVEEVTPEKAEDDKKND